MRCLIVNTLQSPCNTAEVIKNELTDRGISVKLISTSNLTISNCVGCNDCWLKTPGICRIKDDHEQVIKAYLKADIVVYLSETSLGFVSYKLKNIIDRILPLATMNLTVRKGQIRHLRRYNKSFKMALVYTGEADNAYLNKWLGMVQENMNGASLGAYEVNAREELYNALAGN